MRFILATTLALTLLLPFAEAQIKKEISEVTNKTRLVSTDMRPLITESYPGHASFRAEYEVTDADTTWQLSFYGFVKQSTDMGAATQVRVQVDGQSFAAQKVESRTRSLNDSILEVKNASFSRSAYERIATGEQVAALIGPFRFEITDPLRKDLRIILDRMSDVESPPTATSVDEE